METRLNSLLRRVWPVFAAGVLMQTTGCVVDVNAIVQGLVSTIATNFITSLVFSALGLPPPIV
jgi:hypothetical protein